jgi:hypothetical protein
MLHRIKCCSAVPAGYRFIATTMINNLTYRSVEEAAKLGGDNLRVFGRLVAHRIDAVMYSARGPVAGTEVIRGAGHGAGPVVWEMPAVGSNAYDVWFARY